MIKLEADIKNIRMVMERGEIIFLTYPFKEPLENISNGDYFWVYRPEMNGFRNRYNIFFKDVERQFQNFSIANASISVTSNIIEGHKAYVMTEEELETLKMMSELVN